MGLQRIRHDLATEQQQVNYNLGYKIVTKFHYTAIQLKSESLKYVRLLLGPRTPHSFTVLGSEFSNLFQHFKFNLFK